MASSTSTKSRAGAKTRAQPLNKKKKVPAKKTSRKTAASKSVKSTSGDNEKMILVLDPVLVVNNAIDMHKKFSSYLDKNDESVVIDASLVEMIDTAMIQLLFALVSGLKSKNVEIVWRPPSSEFINRVRSLGLTEKFGIDCPV